MKRQRRPLLSSLDRFPDAILVSGCQRSGTTMMTTIINQADGMSPYASTDDPEFEAAEILAGITTHEPTGRFCFQTTYLNERSYEYLEHRGRFRLVWMVRRPEPVVHSMIYNWSDFALNELFEACGAGLTAYERARFAVAGWRAFTPLRRATSSYVGKTAQAQTLSPALDHRSFMVVDYEAVLADPAKHLPDVFRFLDLPYRPELASMVDRSPARSRTALNLRESRHVRATCAETYARAVALASGSS